MKTRRRHYGLFISRRRNTGSSTSMIRIGNAGQIPTDLSMEILSRLPSKSIAICRCVSKSWDSTLCSRFFTELFMARSSARPRLLLSCRLDGELHVYSAPQVQNPDDKSCTVAADNHMKFPFDCSELYGSLGGLLCLTYLRIVSGRTRRTKTVPVICNPSTGQSLPLPKARTRRVGVKSFFGYDPIAKQFKVLSMTSTVYGKETCTEHQVLTVGGTGKPKWKMIACPLPHYPAGDHGICINGCLYYQALVGEAQDHDDEMKVHRHPSVYGIVCFDVRSESFRFINKAEGMGAERYPVLANYKGKLAALMSDGFYRLTANSTCLELWVLVDDEWSKHVYVLPPLWKNVVGEAVLYFVGVTSADEMVLSPQYISNPFYVFYYNIEGNTIRRVEIQGMDAIRNRRVHISLDHVEDVDIW